MDRPGCSKDSDFASNLQPPAKIPKRDRAEEDYLLTELTPLKVAELLDEIEEEEDEDNLEEEDDDIFPIDIETLSPSAAATIGTPLAAVRVDIPSEGLPNLCLPGPSSSPRPVSSFSSDPQHTQGVLWSENRPTVARVPFSAQSGIRQQPRGLRPIDFFNLLFLPTLFELIVRETNNFAEELFLRGVSPRSRITEWKTLTVDEFKRFLGLMFHMGIVKLNRITDYWNTDKKFNFPFFRTTMSRDRFLNIRQCFHLNKNVDGGKNEDPLHKIKPLLDYFHLTMNNVFYPGEELAIDESIAPWTGRISIRQYLPLKRHKYGFKLYMATEADGLIHRIIVYAGAKDKELRGEGHASKVVHKLINGLKGEGRSIYVNNFYGSVDLAVQLLKEKTFLTGTLRAH
ncbi:hypothetical protein J437_LFUL019577, partial [Ladona fulva]